MGLIRSIKAIKLCISYLKNRKEITNISLQKTLKKVDVNITLVEFFGIKLIEYFLMCFNQQLIIHIGSNEMFATKSG